MNSITLRPHGTRSAFLTALTACIAIGACAAAARAGEPSATAPTVKVAYGDLNLATDSGNSALYARLEKAAAKVCVVSDIRDLAAVAAKAACEHQAIARAVSQINSPRLAALHSARAPRG
jgi:UrcA family protein